MEVEGKINNRQALVMLLMLVVSSAILLLPNVTAQQATQDAWLAPLGASVFNVAVILIVVTLASRFPGKTLVQYTQAILPRPLGWLLGLMYIIWFIHSNAIVGREFGSFLTTVFLVNTPLVVVISMMFLTAAIAVRQGLAVMSWVAEGFILPLFLLALGLVLILDTPNMDFKRLLPVMGQGWVPLAQSSVIAASWRCQTVVMTMIIPFLLNPQEARRTLFISCVTAGHFLLVLMVAILTTLSPQETAHLTFPIFSMARMISIGNFVERLDTLIMLFWIMGIFVKICLFYYASSIGLAQLTGMKDYRPAVLPLGIIQIALSLLLFDNISQVIDFIRFIFPFYSLTYTLLIPLLLLLLAVVFKKKGPPLQPKAEKTR